MLLGLGVFVLVYALLAAPTLARRARDALEARNAPRLARVAARALSRPGIAFLGAALVVLAGAVAPAAAWSAIDWQVLALIAGMMLLVATLEAAHTFGVLASHLARRLPTPRRLLVGSMIATAVLSALVLNDAVVLLFTPVLIRAARALGASPFPFLAGEAFAANLGSAATPVGNPQNAVIAVARDISYLDFAAALAPIALVGLALGLVFCLLAFRRELGAWQPTAGIPVERIAHPALFLIGALGVAAALVGFALGPAHGVPLWGTALGVGLVVLALASTTRVPARRIVARFDGGILVFFVGLFVLLQTVRDAGVLDALSGLFTGYGTAGFVAATAILSNLVSNVPAVLLILPTLTTNAQALLLAVSSTFAGNLTFLGSAATVIVAETARADGVEFDAWRFTRVGLLLGAATLAVAWLMLPA